VFVSLVEVSQQGRLQLAAGAEVVGGQHLALHRAEHELNLIQPRRVHGEPVELDGTRQPQRPEPDRKLLGSMGGAVVENQVNRPGFPGGSIP